MRKGRRRADKCLEEEILWLENNESTVFDGSLLYSDNLNQWVVKASRRLFGQDASE